MNTRYLMTQRTTVQRNAPASDTGGGYTDSWSNSSVDVPCAKWSVSDAFLMSSSRPEAINTRAVAVPLDTDVKVGDQLDSIRDRQGNVVVQGPFKVDDIAERPDHLRLMCQKES